MKIKKGNVTVSSGSNGTNKNLITTILASVLTLALAIGIFFVFSIALAKESYYVLNQDIPAKTQVTESMLKEIQTAKGSAPQNAISIQQVRQGTVFSRIPLKTGDILSASTTGLDLDSTNGIPDDWVIVSFNISADNAAGGNISKGDYFDVIGVDPEQGSKYIFFNLLALEVNYTQGENKVTSDGKVVPLGEQLQYVVGLPADQAPILLHVFEKYKSVKLAISPVSLKYKDRNLNGLDKIYNASNNLPAVDLFKGTDNAFTPVLRDSKGLPVTQDNCTAGKVTPDTLCANLDKLPKSRDIEGKPTTANGKSESKKASEVNSKTSETSSKTSDNKSSEKQDKDKQNKSEAGNTKPSDKKPAE